jgi:flagellar biosynthesis/type III secretory pathway chaperone
LQDILTAVAAEIADEDDLRQWFEQLSTELRLLQDRLQVAQAIADGSEQQSAFEVRHCFYAAWLSSRRSTEPRFQTIAADLTPVEAQISVLAERHAVCIEKRKHVRRSADSNGSTLAADAKQMRQALVQGQETAVRRTLVSTLAHQQQVATTSLDQRLQELQQTVDSEQTSAEDLTALMGHKDELEAELARLERALADIPEGPEGDEARRRLQMDLSRLRGWLAKLFGLAFSRRDQLDELQNRMDKLAADLDEIDGRVRPITSAEPADDKSKGKKKKGKKTTPPPSGGDLAGQIATLAQAQTDLESKSPELEELKRLSSESGSSVRVQQLEEHFTALLVLIKVGLSTIWND